MNWERLAEPQGDGYDSRVLLERASQEMRCALRPTEGDRIWSDGEARWYLEPPVRTLPGADYRVLQAIDPFVTTGIRLLDLWPAMRVQCAQLMFALCPMANARFADHRGAGHGCSCGNFDHFGWIYVTADDAWGFAEGIVHEMAHWKLRALGIWFEDWTPLLLVNDPAARYASPVRKDVLRPMGAVLHAQYSYVHVAQMTTLMLRAADPPTEADRKWCALHLMRIQEGQETLRRHAAGTKAGRAFLTALDDWTTKVLEDGREAVDALG